MSFDEVEARREFNEGPVFEEWAERMSAEDAYELEDPKHPDHHDVFSEEADADDLESL